MTRYSSSQKIYACPRCGAENLVTPLRSINTLVPDLPITGEVDKEAIFCHSCGSSFEISDANFIGWDRERYEKNAVSKPSANIPAFLKRTNSNQ